MILNKITEKWIVQNYVFEKLMPFQTDCKDVFFHKHTILNVKLILPILHFKNTDSNIPLLY
jgi:hypothetical protein